MKTKSPAWLALLALPLLAAEPPAAPAPAATPVPAATAAPRASDGSNPLISLDFQDKPLSEVADYLSRLAGVTIAPAPEMASRKITVLVHTLDWKKALGLVAEQAGGYVEEVAPNLYKITNPPRVTYATLTEGNDIKEVLAVIAEYAGANIVISESVKGKVNLRLKDVPWKHAVQQAVKAAGDYTVVQEDFNLLRVIPTSALANQIENRVFGLKFLHAPANYKATLKTNYALARDYTPTGIPKDLKPPLEDFTLYKSLKNCLTPGLGKLEYDFISNSFIATDVKPRLDEMQRIIELLDVEPVQIQVDVKFVITSNTDLFDFGIDWGTAGNTGPRPSISGGSMLHKLPFNIGDGGFEDHLTLSRLPDGSAGGPNAADLATAGNHFTFGTLDFTSVQAVLKFFKRDVESKVVQSPKIITLDNEEATIFVGDTIKYAKTEASSSSSGTLTFVLTEVDTPVRTGFQLYVLPHVVPGTGKILMTVIPEANDLSGTGAGIAGFDRYTNGTQTIDLPRVTSRTLVTKMLLEDGQTVVIGGLLKENQSKSTNKLPFFGDLPLIGWLFKSEDRSAVQDNLVIFITPRVVRNSAETQSALATELKARDKQLQNEFPQSPKTEPEAKEAEKPPQQGK